MHVKFADGADDIIVGLAAPNGGPFNGRDIEGEYFTKSTDFCEDWFPESRPLLYNHGLDEDAGVSVVGRVKSWWKDDAGLWVQAQLDRGSKYFADIKTLMEKSSLYFSSGAMSHLVEIGKSGEITRWPWVEQSLTPTPANPYATLDFATAKSHFKAVGADIDEAEIANRLAGVQAPVVDALGRPMDRAAFPGEPRDEHGHPIKAVGDGAVTDSRECSYEDIMGDLSALLNPTGPFSSYSYSSLIATYPTYCIVCRYEYDGYEYDGDATYWKVAYTIGDDMEPRLGEAIQIEQTYIPATKSAEHAVVPLSLDAQSLTRHAAVLVERTQDLHSRRTKEGRVLSDANRRTLADAHEKMGAAHQALSDLLDATDRAKAEAAKAAQAGDPTVQQRLQAIRELELAVLESYLDA